MKILGENVVIGTKKICVEYTTKIQGSLTDSFVGSCEYKGNNLEENVVFIRDKNGYLVEVSELGTFPTLSLICFGAATRWKTFPRNAGDFYVDDVKPYFSKSNQETLYDLNILIKILKNSNESKCEESTIELN